MEELSEIFKKSLKISFTKIILVILYLGWQFFYSYLGYRAEYLGQIFEYFGLGLGLVNWNNYFIRGTSMILLWVIVAVIIFLALWILQAVKLKKKPKLVGEDSTASEDYLVKVEGVFASIWPRLRSYLLIFSGYFLILLGFTVFSDIFESMRYYFSEMFSGGVAEEGTSLGGGASVVNVLSFVLVSPVWYLYTVVVVFLTNYGRGKVSDIEIADNHFAIAVDETPPDTEE